MNRVWPQRLRYTPTRYVIDLSHLFGSRKEKPDCANTRGLIIGQMEPLYLEDMHVGQRFSSGTYLMEESRIKEFAAEFDPQPFHLDEAAAQASVFHGLAASGWHTAAASMSLLVKGGLPVANGTIGLGGEIAWPKPTRPGDVLRVESEIIEIVPSRSKPNQGIVTVKSTTLNQNGEPVYVFTAKILMFRRVPLAAGESRGA
jgi:acyl dehydratase